MLKVNYKSFRTYFAPFSGASIVDFEQLNVSLATSYINLWKRKKKKRLYNTRVRSKTVYMLQSKNHNLLNQIIHWNNQIQHPV